MPFSGTSEDSYVYSSIINKPKKKKKKTKSKGLKVDVWHTFVIPALWKWQLEGRNLEPTFVIMCETLSHIQKYFSKVWKI